MKPMVQLNVRVTPEVMEYLQRRTTRTKRLAKGSLQDTLEKIILDEMERAPIGNLLDEDVTKYPPVVSGPQVTLAEQFKPVDLDSITVDELRAVFRKSRELAYDTKWLHHPDRFEIQVGAEASVPASVQNIAVGLLEAEGFVASGLVGGTEARKVYYVAVYGRIASKQVAQPRRRDRRRGGARLNNPATWPKSLHAALDQEKALDKALDKLTKKERRRAEVERELADPDKRNADILRIAAEADRGWRELYYKLASTKPGTLLSMDVLDGKTKMVMRRTAKLVRVVVQNRVQKDAGDDLKVYVQVEKHAYSSFGPSTPTGKFGKPTKLPVKQVIAIGPFGRRISGTTPADQVAA